MTYHSGLSARDRDRLRQQVLEGLGWNIHRIWSTDWFKQSKTEVDRIVAHVEQLLRAEDASAAAFQQDTEADFEGAGGASDQVDALSPNDASWEGEVAVQPMSDEDARQALIALGEEALSEFPGVPPDAFVLRPDMVRALLRAKPATKDDWLRNIPFDLRIATDGNQLGALLPRILAITGRLAR
jgi:hypothetical protein